MKNHLTERELIEYQFKLASDVQMSQAAGHLRKCGQCRELLEKLKRKFAALDLLRDDVKVSEDLIALVTEQAAQPVKRGIVPFKKSAWARAVAAVLLIGFLVLVADLSRQGKEKQKIAEGPFPAMEEVQLQSKKDSRSLDSAQDGFHANEKEPVVVAEETKEAKIVTDSEEATIVVDAEEAEIAADAEEAEIMADAEDAEIVADAEETEIVADAEKTEIAADAEEVKIVTDAEEAEIMADAEDAEIVADAEEAEIMANAEDAEIVADAEETEIVAETEKVETVVEMKEAEIVAESVEVEALEKAIPQQPPFAPASAIELVTLPRRDNVQLTIYNSADLTLVRERRNLTLKKGWNWLQFMWANTLIDPTSLSLEPMAQADKIDIQQLVFPARLRELGRWLIRSEISGQVPFEITYFTSGLSWRAFYMGTLSRDEKTMRLTGYVRLDNNSGEDYENAQTRLIVGQVHLLDEIAELARRRYPYNSPIGIIVHARDSRWRFDMKDEETLEGDALIVNGLGDFIKGADELRRKEIVKEGLSEYFLYTIEGTETIADKWGKRLHSFEAEDVNVMSLYKYDEERWSNQTIRFISFANDEEHNLGQTPIPNGNVKIYGIADEQGHLSYVGGTDIKYIPVNEEVELNLGPARLVSVEPKLIDFKTENFFFDSKGDITGWDEIRTWEIEITNTRELPVEVEITRGFSTAYWTLLSNIPREKYDATHVRFKLNLEPRSKRSFKYEVRTYHGEREEAMSQ